MTQIKITHSLASEIYQILIDECGAESDKTSAFIFAQTHENPRPSEWRIFGKLGNGGLFCNSNEERLYVSCYVQDLNDDRNKLIRRVNEKLADLLKPKPRIVTCYFVAKSVEDNYGNESVVISSEIFLDLNEAVSKSESISDLSKNPDTFMSKFRVERASINRTSLEAFIAKMSDEELRSIRQ